jgi:hypothetical protein
MRAFAFCLVLATACQKPSTPVPPAVPPGPSPVSAPAPGVPDAGGSEWTAAQEACVDRWLAAHGLDAYGSPQGTMYMGGTPLFDEATGQRRTRQAFLAAHHPEPLRGCGLLP